MRFQEENSIPFATDKEDSVKFGFSHILKYPEVARKLFVISVVWTLAAMVATHSDCIQVLRFGRVRMTVPVLSQVGSVDSQVYNGMSFAVSDLKTDTYFAFFLSGLAEIPGIYIAWVAMERYGRKGTVFWSLVLSGILPAATPFVPERECAHLVSNQAYSPVLCTLN